MMSISWVSILLLEFFIVCHVYLFNVLIIFSVGRSHILIAEKKLVLKANGQSYNDLNLSDNSTIPQSEFRLSEPTNKAN